MDEVAYDGDTEKIINNNNNVKNGIYVILGKYVGHTSFRKEMSLTFTFVTSLHLLHQNINVENQVKSNNLLIVA
jgi:hypothetical protein